MTIERILELVLGNLGVLVLLLLILVGGFRKWWVYGWIYQAQAKAHLEEMQKAEKRLDRLERVAQGGTILATRATELAESRQAEVSGDRTP